MSDGLQVSKHEREQWQIKRWCWHSFILLWFTSTLCTIQLICVMVKNSVSTSRKTHRLYYNDSLLMLFGEIVSAYSENRKKHINTVCGQTADLIVMFKSVGTYIRTVLWRVKFETWTKYPQYCTDSLHGKWRWLLFLRWTHSVATNDCSVNRAVVHYRTPMSG
jgi:hypothetical protein